MHNIDMEITLEPSTALSPSHHSDPPQNTDTDTGTGTPTLTLTLTDARLTQDLEFIQSLTNVDYLRFLAQNGFFGNPAFLNYLDGLSYLARPEYARFLMYDILFILLHYADKHRLVECTNVCTWADDWCG